MANPTTNPANLKLAPSLFHLELIKHAPKSLAYDGGDFAVWRRKMQAKLKTLLGLDHLSQPRVPLKAKTLWSRKHDLGTIEKVAFRSEVGADVLAYVCLPSGVKPPYDFVICVQGHSPGMHWSIGMEADEKTPRENLGDRDFGLGAMRRGVAALCIEQRAFGQRGENVQQQRAEHPCHDAAMQGMMLGRPLAGQRVFDVDRGIDYLKQRGDCRMKTIGVMGNSGGGTVAQYAPAMLPRIRWGMPSCSVCSYAKSIMQIYHCADNYIPNILQYGEIGDAVGAAAPKPLVVVAGKEDTIFPIGGTRDAYKQLKRIYTAAGAEKNLHLVVGPEGHRFYADSAWKKALPIVEQLRG